MKKPKANLGNAPMKKPRKIDAKVEKAKELIKEGESALSLDQAVAVLDRLRRAYREWDAAHHELLEGLFPLVHDAYPDLWGSLWIGLATAIDRLTRNQEPDLLEYVLDELERAEREFWCQESGHIYPPASTNSTRKQRGDEPHPALRRHVGNIDDSQGVSEGQTRINRKGERETYWFRVPIKLPTTPEHEEEKWRPYKVVATDEERRVLELLLGRFSLKQIAERTGLTNYRVRQIKQLLQERMRRLEAEK